jgi:hypothetical protein
MLPDDLWLAVLNKASFPERKNGWGEENVEPFYVADDHSRV